MQRPEAVERVLDGESVATRVPLGGEDAAYLTATRTVVYRGEGLLSEESVAEYPHDADRLVVEEGRRQATVGYEYPAGRREFAVPVDRLEDVVGPVVAGLVRSRGQLADGERVLDAFRFSEMTVAVTTDRLLKHVGSTLWTDDPDEIRFDAVTGLDYEEGSVATGVVIGVGDRNERLKAPNDRLPAFRDALESALFAHRDVESAAELGPDDDGEDGTGPDRPDPVGALDVAGVDPLDAGGTTDDGDDSDAGPADDPEDTVGGGAEDEGAEAGTTGVDAGSDGGAERDGDGEEVGRDGDSEDAERDGGGEDDGNDEDPWADSPFETVPPEGESEGVDPAVAAELAELREAVERQNALIADTRRVLSQVVTALDREFGGDDDDAGGDDAGSDDDADDGTSASDGDGADADGSREDGAEGDGAATGAPDGD